MSPGMGVSSAKTSMMASLAANAWYRKVLYWEKKLRQYLNEKPELLDKYYDEFRNPLEINLVYFDSNSAICQFKDRIGEIDLVRENDNEIRRIFLEPKLSALDSLQRLKEIKVTG